jgi:arylsulfatase A-like enzyme
MTNSDAMNRRKFLALSTSAAALVVQQGRRPNVLLIVADDLGYSDLGCFGGEIDTPNLNMLASGGVRLTQFYSTARCCPSRASILTGQYSHRVGIGHMVTDLGQPGYTGRLSDKAATIAEVLKQAGYRTFMSGKWHVGTDDPTRHGFEQFYGTPISAASFWDPSGYLRRPQGSKTRSYEKDTFYGTDALTDHGLDFLEDAQRTLYFEHEGHRAVREGRYKLPALRGESWKLYDIERDRTEMEDLAANQPKPVDSLSKKWEAWAAENHVTPLPRNYRVNYLRRP